MLFDAQYLMQHERLRTDVQSNAVLTVAHAVKIKTCLIYIHQRFWFLGRKYGTPQGGTIDQPLDSWRKDCGTSGRGWDQSAGHGAQHRQRLKHHMMVFLQELSYQGIMKLKKLFDEAKHICYWLLTFLFFFTEGNISDERALQLKEWLRNNSQPLSQIQTYMQDTAVYRAKCIRDNNWTIDQILQEFPRLMAKGMVSSRKWHLTCDEDALFILLVCYIEMVLKCVFYCIDCTGFSCPAWGCCIKVVWKLATLLCWEDPTSGKTGGEADIAPGWINKR